MTFDKTVIHRMNMPYAIGTLGTGQERSIVCATEDHGPVVRIAPPFREARTLVPGPGGCMALVCDPEKPADLYVIMGCFLLYKFQGGGIYRIHTPREGEAAAVRLFDLPFAHRIGLARRGASRYLLAANLAADKKDAADWTLPGGVYAAQLDGDADTGLQLQPVLPGIHKNHGFLLADLEGRASLLICGSEGVLAVDLQSSDKDWQSRQVLAQETSEIAVFDLDGDGADELVTIEPFHGNALRAYKRLGKNWSAFWDTELEFGHCVLAGMFEGRRSVFVSNRSGSRSLLLFQFGEDGTTKPRRIVVEDGAGAANMLVLRHAGRDHLFAANQAAGEVVRYTPRPA
jgi:hypothetical protein